MLADGEVRMSWRFDDLVKGQVTQTILRAVLERVGYRVYPLGIEELVPELCRDVGHALRGNLPERLRFLPDFMIIDPESSGVYLAEVKFRRRLSEDSLRSVSRELLQRRQFWPETSTVLMVAESDGDRGFHQDHIRVITSTLGERELLGQQPLRTQWENLPQLQQVFRRIQGSFDNQQVVDAITQPLQDLAKIQRPKTLGEIRQWDSS